MNWFWYKQNYIYLFRLVVNIFVVVSVFIFEAVTEQSSNNNNKQTKCNMRKKISLLHVKTGKYCRILSRSGFEIAIEIFYFIQVFSFCFFASHLYVMISLSCYLLFRFSFYGVRCSNCLGFFGFFFTFFTSISIIERNIWYFFVNGVIKYT